MCLPIYLPVYAVWFGSFAFAFCLSLSQSYCLPSARRVLPFCFLLCHCLFLFSSLCLSRLSSSLSCLLSRKERCKKQARKEGRKDRSRKVASKQPRMEGSLSPPLSSFLSPLSSLPSPLVSSPLLWSSLLSSALLSPLLARGGSKSEDCSAFREQPPRSLFGDVSTRAMSKSDDSSAFRDEDPPHPRDC